MALDFPSGPTTGQTYTDTISGFTWQWDGVVWKNYYGSLSGVGITAIIEDQSPALGAHLNINGNIISGTGGVDITGIVTATDFNSSSDLVLKENVHEIDDPISKVIKIRGVSFDWKNNGNSSAGVIAQDIENVMPELVKENNGTKTVNYNGLIGLLVEVAKDQQEQINNLKSKVT